MLKFALLTAATALATFIPIEPSIEFTSDSVYKDTDIINIELKESDTFEETYLVDVYFSEVTRPGYKIYNDPETSYIDGLQWDHLWVSDWKVEDVDFSVPHVITIKTVYTNDYAGMMMSAKDGDFSMLLSNPETILKVAYYALATVSVIIALFSTMFGKKKKAKTAEEISGQVDNASERLQEKTINQFNEFLSKTLAPMFSSIESQYADIIKGFLLSKSDSSTDTLALVELLKNTIAKQALENTETSEELKVNKETLKKAQAEIETLADNLKESIQTSIKEKEEKVAQAKQDIHDLASDIDAIDL